MTTNRIYAGKAAYSLMILTGMAMIAGLGFSTDAQAQYASSHSQMGLVISDGQSECTTHMMTLIDDYTWSFFTPIPSGDTYYFQFWPDGALDDKYGSVGVPWLLVYDVDPPNAVHQFSAPGYYNFILYEDEPLYAIEAATGTITANISYDNNPAVLPSDASVTVIDETEGIELFTLLSGDGETITIDNLLTGHTYGLTFTASGYDNQMTSVQVPSETPVEVNVTLDYIVSNEDTTWGVIKALYR
jgi:hypothetical protein